MFGQTMEVKIGTAHPRVLIENDTPRRITEIHLHLDADDDLAAGMGEAAVDALKHLRSGATASSVVMLDALKVRADFSAGDKDKMRLDCAVERASLRKPKKEDSGPICTLRLAFATKQEPLWWLVEHLDTTVKLRLTKIQLELAKTTEAAK